MDSNYHLNRWILLKYMRNRPYTMTEINTILKNSKSLHSLETVKEILLIDLKDEFNEDDKSSIERAINFKVQTLAMLN